MIKVKSYWKQVADLTIYDAAIWMVMRESPRALEFRLEQDEYAAYYSAVWDEAVYEMVEILISLVRAGLIEESGAESPNNRGAASGKTRILKADWLSWCEKNGHRELAEAFSSEARLSIGDGADGGPGIDIVAAAPPRHHTSADRRKQLDLSKERGARRWILENWDTIEGLYGPRPRPDQVLKLLGRDPDEKKTSLKNVQNLLPKLSAEGLIPPRVRPPL